MSDTLREPGDRFDDPADRRLAAWIEHTVSCEITAFERQRRWRPGWYVDVVTSAGEPRSLYVRGNRPQRDSTEPFQREYQVLSILESEGIPVPHIHGLCADPLAIVQDRAPGRPDLSTARSDEERASVLDQYIEVLARVHQIDPAKFAAAGLVPPDGPRELMVANFDRYVAEYREKKQRPEPVVEFLIGWVHRNAPLHRTKVSFLVCDVGQFMFDDGKLTALLDLEMAHLGDALQDLAAFQFRNTSEPLGDIARALRHYEEITGEPIDADVFDFHAIAFAAITPIGMTRHVALPMPTASVVQYLEWWLHGSRWPLEIIAARTNVVLPEPEPIAPEPTSYHAMAESLVHAIGVLPVDGEFAAYEVASTANLAAFMARVGQLGPPTARADKADVEAFLGESFDSLDAADTALEALVVAAGPEDDARLLPLLYRRVQRHCALFAPFLSRPTVANRMRTFRQMMAT